MSLHLPELFKRPALVSTLLAAALLAGCAVTHTPGGVPIDTSRSSVGQDSRVLFLVIHYTVADLPISLKILTEQQVSSHYLLSDEARPRIYRLVDEGRRAWHSGASGWKGHRMLNSSSIGIEIVHPGSKPGPDGQPVYQPFPPHQIDALIPLIQDIVKRHEIKPERILGHGEVTPAYKQDPGPTFPWRRLAELGITPPWPDAALVDAARARHTLALPDVLWFQQALEKHGYPMQVTGVMDTQTERVLMNFQMRYRPTNYSGQMDAESAAILDVLTMPKPAAAPGTAPSPFTPPPSPFLRPALPPAAPAAPAPAASGVSPY
jgi:N-acetylmuramoyl-L-alanine amidase